MPSSYTDNDDEDDDGDDDGDYEVGKSLKYSL